MECEPLYYWSGPRYEWPCINNPCTWQGTLTPYQRHAAERIAEAVRSEDKELLIWAVCGAGKTEMLFPGIAEALTLGKRVCVATPRADVVRELLPRFEASFKHTKIQGLYGGADKKDDASQLTISTTHQLLRYREAFDVMVIDEVDAFPFHKDPSLPYAADRAKTLQSTTVYLTATPRKTHHRRIRQKKLPHIFVPVRFHGHPLPVPLLKMCFTLKKDFQNNQFPPSMIRWLSVRKNPDRQLLIFVPTIELAEKLVETWKVSNLSTAGSAAPVHASDPKREQKVDAFRKRQLDVLVTTTILERGVTFPSVDVAVLHAGHEVFDEAALIQISGRAGRSPDDPEGEVLFFHDGKTESMMKAVREIKNMNRRGGFSRP
ncbi:DEAD/DEAH box helicase [Virgibacillus sediminis]|uniref:DEAD/DEAH box helicase n=1 Tax=Virgibacillus sediminis TaxID=202260 RepID=A0ABV7A2H6_9BACI